MATTVTASNLSVTITENVSLGGKTWGNSRIKTFAGQGEVDQRIMSIAAGEGVYTEILYLSSVDARGQVVVNNFSYFRITNLDDTNFITLQLYISATESIFHKIEAGESYLLMSPDAEAQCEVAAVTLADITRIQADADTTACDIEYVIVTTGAAVSP